MLQQVPAEVFVISHAASLLEGGKPSADNMSRVLNAIVAVCPDLGIGKNGDLPWHPIRLK